MGTRPRTKQGSEEIQSISFINASKMEKSEANSPFRIKMLTILGNRAVNGVPLLAPTPQPRLEPAKSKLYCPRLPEPISESIRLHQGHNAMAALTQNDDYR